MTDTNRLTDADVEWHANHGAPLSAAMARELLAYRRAGVAQPAACTWPSCGHTARGQCVPVTPPPASRADADLRAAAATILGVLHDPDSLPYAQHPDWQAIYDAMTDDHKESVEISGDNWHDWPSILIAGLEVMAEPRAALSTPAPSRPDGEARHE